MRASEALTCLKIGDENAEAINLIRGPPSIVIKINEKRVVTIVDSGADRTLCHDQFAAKIYGPGWEKQLKPSAARLTTASGQYLNITGELEMEIHFQHIMIRWSVIITSNTVAEFLLGNDIMQNRMTLEKGHTLIVYNPDDPDDAVRIPITRTAKRMKVKTIENEVIPPHANRLIACMLVGLDEEELEDQAMKGQLVYTTINLNDPYAAIQVEDSIALIEDHYKVVCSIMNPTDESIEIGENSIIGSADLAVESSDNTEGGILFVQLLTCEDDTESELAIRYLHDPETRESILTGDKSGLFPPPKGYEPGPTDKEAKFDYDRIRTPGLSEIQRTQLINVLRKYEEVFSKGPGDYGKTALMTFKIDTGDAEPIASRYIPIPAAYEAQVRKALQEMSENNIIEECESPWNNSLVIVKKPNGTLRLCVNLKNVNSVTINKTSYPINYQEQSFAKLCNGKFFFRIDLSQAYYSIQLDSESTRDKTAFSALGRQYRFITSPYGARYLPSKFNRLMAIIFRGLEDYLFFYFDDAIASLQTFEELLSALDEVLKRILTANLRVNFQKSDFCLTNLDEIKWLGSIVRDGSVHPDPKKVEAIVKMPIPQAKRAMMRFLGAISYHRRHIPNLSDIVAPLYKLCPPKAKYVLGEKEINAFQKAKDAIINAKSLVLPDLTKKFIVTCDASDIGIGGVLTQEDQDGEEKPVAYCSRTFTSNEQNCSSCEKEILAILYTVSVFSYYLVNNKFLLRTDSKSLVYLRYFSNLNSKLFRASILLDELDFDIEHVSAKRGNIMNVADMLSRAYGESAPDPKRASYKQLRNPVFNRLIAPPTLPHGRVGKMDFEMHADKYLATFLQENKEDIENNKYVIPRLAKCLQESEVNLKGDYTDFINQCRQIDHSDSIEHVSSQLMLRVQNSDKVPERHNYILMSLLHQSLFTIDAFMRAQLDDDTLKDKILGLQGTPKGTRQNGYFLKKGILFKEHINEAGISRPLLVIPAALVPTLLNHYHGPGAGPHMGRKQMLDTLRSHYLWAGMPTDIMNHCRKCVACLYNQRNPDPQYVLERKGYATRPNEIVNWDIVGPLVPAADGARYILTMQDSFSKFMLAVPIRSKETGPICKVFVSHWIVPFGPPKFLRSDMGRDTDSGLVQYLCKTFGIHKIRTPAYTPHANPIERWHATLMQSLRAWLPDPELYKRWSNIVPFIAMQYNHTVHSVTKCKPAELFINVLSRNNYGYFVPVIPESDPVMAKYPYLKELRYISQLCTAFANEQLRKAHGKRHINKLGKHKEPRQYFVGQKVLIKNHAPNNKMDSRYIGPFTIVKVNKNSLECVQWKSAEQLRQDGVKLRYHHDPIEGGDILKRKVHHRDVKPFELETTPQPRWDNELAKKFFRQLDFEEPEIQVPETDLTMTTSTTTTRASSPSSVSSMQSPGSPGGSSPGPGPPPGPPPHGQGSDPDDQEEDPDDSVEGDDDFTYQPAQQSPQQPDTTMQDKADLLEARPSATFRPIPVPGENWSYSFYPSHFPTPSHHYSWSRVLAGDNSRLTSPLAPRETAANVPEFYKLLATPSMIQSTLQQTIPHTSTPTQTGAIVPFHYREGQETPSPQSELDKLYRSLSNDPPGTASKDITLHTTPITTKRLYEFSRTFGSELAQQLDDRYKLLESVRRKQTTTPGTSILDTDVPKEIHQEVIPTSPIPTISPTPVASPSDTMPPIPLPTSFNIDTAQALASQLHLPDKQQLDAIIEDLRKQDQALSLPMSRPFTTKEASQLNFEWKNRITPTISNIYRDTKTYNNKFLKVYSDPDLHKSPSLYNEVTGQPLAALPFPSIPDLPKLNEIPRCIPRTRGNQDDFAVTDRQYRAQSFNKALSLISRQLSTMNKDLAAREAAALAQFYTNNPASSSDSETGPDKAISDVPQDATTEVTIPPPPKSAP